MGYLGWHGQDGPKGEFPCRMILCHCIYQSMLLMNNDQTMEPE